MLSKITDMNTIETTNVLQIEVTSNLITDNFLSVKFDASGVEMMLDITHLTAIAILSDIELISVGRTFEIPNSDGACKLEKVGEVQTFEGWDEVTTVVHPFDFLNEIVDVDLCETLVKECLLDTYYVRYIDLI